jgi:hypothetical protein
MDRDKVAYYGRMIKRMNKAANQSELPTWKYTVGEHNGTIIAQTRSAARAEIKRETGLKKLKNLSLEKINGEQKTS